MTKDSEIFNKAYNDLNKALNTLRNSKEEDIETLFDCVETAITAKAICHERLDKIKTLLDEKISPNAE